MRRALKYGLLGVLALLIAGIVAPFIRVDRYREQIRDGLQRALHRKVDIHGETHLNLFRGPGFTVEKVVIHDDPAVGLEPLANVPELQASVRLSSLWSGSIEFAMVRFVEPSVNIVKPDSGIWNLAPLLLGAGAQPTVRLPEIQVSDGRLNFKFGNTKSAFYLTDTDLTVTPSGGGLDIRFSTAPARTDRAAGGYGLFEGRGRWSAGQIDLDVELAKSSIEELVTLARGQSLGLHGKISSKAKLSGPVTNVRIEGRFDMDDVHRWDLIEGHKGTIAMNYRGSVDFGSQRMELLADQSLNPAVPVALKLVIADILHNPNWGVEIGFNKLPASAVVAAARHMGAPIPADLTIEGLAVGVVAYGSVPGVQGQIAIDNAIVRLNGDGPEFHLPHASVLLSGDELRLQPATLSGQSRAAQLQAVYAPFRQHLEAEISGKGLAIADLQDGPGHLLNSASVPLLNRFRGGTWSGTLWYESDHNEPGDWKARLQIKDTSTMVPGIATRVRIAAADIDLNGERLKVSRLRALVEKTEIYGEYRYEPADERPHRFSLWLPSAEIGDIESALAPALRRNAGFFSRTFRFRNPALPDWLRTRHADGTIRIGTLTAGGQSFRAVRARVIWNGANVQVPVLEARLDEGSVRASAAVDLSRGEPRYRVRGAVNGLDWRGGFVDLDGTIETFGTGADTLANLTAAGDYQLRTVAMSPELAIRSASGTFDLTASRTLPQLKVSVQAMMGSERFTGEGATHADGRMHMDLASTTRVLRLTGPVMPLKLEITNDRVAR